MRLRHVGDVTGVLSKKGRNVGPKRTKILVTNLPEVTARPVITIYRIFHKYQKHEQFTSLLSKLSTPKTRILQTSLAYLSPLKERTKSRFLNLPGIAKWPQQMVRCLDALAVKPVSVKAQL